jgi:predicted dehydrogenase
MMPTVLWHEKGEKSMRVAVAGCGVMGDIHAGNLHRMPNVELVGVFAEREERAQHTASLYTEMIVLCEKKNVRLFIGHVIRFFPGYADIIQQVAAGVIGKLGEIHTKRVSPLPGRAKSWYNNVGSGARNA